MTEEQESGISTLRVDRRHGALAGGALLVVCAIATWTGSVPTRAFGHDTFFLLDNAWREVCGQRVHVDYSSPWGPLSFLVVSLGLRLADFGPEGIAYANAVFGLAVGVWGWGIARHRLNPVVALLIPGFLALIVVAPYALGFYWLDTNRGMLYNRYGYSLLAILAIECSTTDCRGEGQGREIRAGLSTGAIVGLLLFLKISYFFAAALLVAVSLVVVPISSRRVLGGFLGFNLISLAMLAHLDFGLAAMIADLRMAAGAKASSLDASLFLKRFVPNAGLMLLCVLLGWRAGRLRRDGDTSRHRFLFAALGIIAADFFVMLSNQQPTQFPLCALLGLLAIDRVLPARKAQEVGVSAAELRGVFGVGALLFLLQFLPDLLGLVEGARLKVYPGDLAEVEHFEAPRLASTILYDQPGDPYSNGRYYVRYVNSGRALLLAHRQAGERVLNIDMMNPFPYTLGQPPPHGGVAAAAYRYTLSDEHHPSEDAFFGDAELVTVPKQPSSPPAYFDGFLRLYETALHERYVLVADTDLWSLYRRR